MERSANIAAKEGDVISSTEETLQYDDENLRGEKLKQYLVSTQLIEWNGYETRQTPLLDVFVDLKVHNVQKNSYHVDCIDQ